MNLLKKMLAVLALVPVFAFASEEGFQLDHAPERMKDLAALQHGAKLFVNYCLNCHAAASMRYNRMHDIGLTDDQIKANLLFTTDKVGGLMTVALARKDAKEWFGAAPPDLSVIARSKASEAGTGPDWIYTYLRSYYKDDNRPTGWNNMVFPNVGMPHVFWELQGEQKAVFVDEKGEDGKEVHRFDHFELVKPGKLSKLEYDTAVADLVGYLEWMSEPAQNVRHQLGVWVLLFLSLFAVLAWRLNASYWKEVK
ncbi:MAG: cytochrome c1 [Burkholderiaceae bacterium]|nr:cytochrome c1 [Burkholderiaceae bacterium]